MKQIQIEQINSSELMAIVRKAVSEAYNNHQEKQGKRMKKINELSTARVEQFLN